MTKKKSDAITISGRRKTALAKATIKPGTGVIRINNRPIASLSILRRFALEEPLRIAAEVMKSSPQFDISINAKGGGVEGQIEASRLAISRALVAFTKSNELKKAFLSYDRRLLVADTRTKEPYKPNDSKARAARQKSYR